MSLESGKEDGTRGAASKVPQSIMILTLFQLGAAAVDRPLVSERVRGRSNMEITRWHVRHGEEERGESEEHA